MTYLSTCWSLFILLKQAIKTRQRLVKILFFIGLSVSLSAQGAQPKSPFVLADDGDFGPFSYNNANGELAGIFPKIYVEVFRRLNIPLLYEGYPWRRTQKLIAEGAADAMITIPTPARLEYLVASDPLFIEPFAIWARRDHPRVEKIMAIDSIADIHGYKIVELKGNGWAETELTRDGLDLDIMWVGQNTLPQILLLNRADLAIMPVNVSRYTLRKNELDMNNSLIHSKHYLRGNSFCLMVRKNSQYVGIIPEFNRVLAEMKSDGSYDKIVEGYFTLEEFRK
ncbi:transporter substrate-binding domain-containing protein [Motilimonas cestriensis]|uniref:Transporter substrate-binding domain-containing protein n=1 Tax=Motilimonas cestriensis TaxID=2742685 RepID=A0ABS8WB01_9GAMM|nr:transporter substrate-binding domain-containing protein [Motilimonas cestriensis]MCE2595472.1 transporter substrate-binding domain-containing protein [Motilimonas cestriensis]